MMFRTAPIPSLLASVLSASVLSASVLILAALPVQAGEAGTRYASWHGCLDHHFGLRAAIGSRLIAADAALGACREPERAYLAALAASPLLDADDAQQARAALVARARARLLGRRAAL